MDGSTRIHPWITVRMAIPAEQLDGMRRRGHWIDRQKGTNVGVVVTLLHVGQARRSIGSMARVAR